MVFFFAVVAVTPVGADEQPGETSGETSTASSHTQNGTNVSFLVPFLDEEVPLFHLDTGKLQFGVSGYGAIKGIVYGHANRRDNGLELDAATLRVEGRLGRASFVVEPDLVGVDSRNRLFEVTASYDIDDDHRVSIGQFRLALSSDYATRESDLPFIGYGFPSHLTGRYDIGVRVDGSVADDLLYYEASATIGEGFGLEGQDRESPGVSLRLVAHPARLWSDEIDDRATAATAALDGLFFGIGLAWMTEYDDPLLVTNPVESVVFTTGDLDADGARFTHLEAGYTYGPLSFSGERVLAALDSVPVGGGATEDIDQISSWAVTAAWNLTGEPRRWHRGGWQSGGDDAPRSLALIEDFTRGRIELASRYANADIDRELFDSGLTTYDPSTQEVRTFEVELNWYRSRAVRLGLGYVRTIADHELSTLGGKNRDSSYFARLDVRF